MNKDEEQLGNLDNDELNTTDGVEFVMDDESDGAVADFQEKYKKLKEKLIKCETEKNEYLDGWQRSRAEFVNYKKEEGDRIIRTISLARERFILDFLPALDSFDMAFSNKEAWEKVDKNWRMGVEYIQQQILKILEDHQITLIQSKIGDIFDPQLHQSIGVIEATEKDKDHTLASITQSGYQINDSGEIRVLRPARVNVFEYKE